MKTAYVTCPPEKKGSTRTEHPMRHANEAKKEPNVVEGKQNWAYWHDETVG